MKRNWIRLFTIGLALSGAGLCPAGVVNDRLYRLGEDDVPTAVPLGAGDAVTVDAVSGINATKVGLTYYYGKPGLGGPATSLGLAPGSTEAMEFTNIDSRYVAPASLVGVTQNFGIEGYVLVSGGVTQAKWFYNGGSGLPGPPPSDGYGLGVVSGQYAAFVSGSTFLTGVVANPLQPVEMALVNTGGTNFTVYIQDVPVLMFAAAVVAPTAAEMLSLGNFSGNFSPPLYSGVIDEARTFSFAPGGFNPSTDLSPAAAAIPEPMSLILGGIAIPFAMGLWWHHERRRVEADLVE